MTHGQPFAEVLAAAISRRALPLEAVHEALLAQGVSVSLATLSYWRSGRSEPGRETSRRFLPVLEGILDLDPGALSTSLAPPKPRGRSALRTPVVRTAVESVLPVPALAEQILKVLHISDQDLIRVSVNDRLVVGSDRISRDLTTRTLWRCERDGVESYPVVFEQDLTVPGAAEVRALSWCRLGRMVRLAERNLTVAEMLFPRPLRRGELVLTLHRIIEAPGSDVAYRAQRGMRYPIEEVIVEAVFDPAATPRQAEQYRRASLAHPETDIVPVPVVDGLAQAAFVGLPGGVAGLRWSWD